MNDITFDPLDYCRPGLAGLAPYEPGKPPGALERELGVRDAVKLASNENLRGPSPQALAALRRALTDVHFYPDGGGHQLKELLAARHGERKILTHLQAAERLGDSLQAQNISHAPAPAVCRGQRAA